MPEPVPATLAEALAVLQGRLPRVAKEHTAHVTSQKTGKTHTYDYADLLDVSEAILPPMSALGLSFVAMPTLIEQGFVLNYILKHVGGDQVEGFYPLPSSGSPQEIGTAITYARRYALCAVTGLAPGGDDDDAATVRDPKRAERSHPRGPDPDDPWAQDAPVDHQRAEALRRDLEGRDLTDAEDKPGSRLDSQHRVIERLLGQLGIAADNRTDRHNYVTALLCLDTEIGSFNNLSYTQAADAIKALQADLAKEKADA